MQALVPDLQAPDFTSFVSSAVADPFALGPAAFEIPPGAEIVYTTTCDCPSSRKTSRKRSSGKAPPPAETFPPAPEKAPEKIPPVVPTDFWSDVRTTKTIDFTAERKDLYFNDLVFVSKEGTRHNFSRFLLAGSDFECLKKRVSEDKGQVAKLEFKDFSSQEVNWALNLMARNAFDTSFQVESWDFILSMLRFSFTYASKRIVFALFRCIFAMPAPWPVQLLCQLMEQMGMPFTSLAERWIASLVLTSPGWVGQQPSEAFWKEVEKVSPKEGTVPLLILHFVPYHKLSQESAKRMVSVMKGRMRHLVKRDERGMLTLSSDQEMQTALTVVSGMQTGSVQLVTSLFSLSMFTLPA